MGRLFFYCFKCRIEFKSPRKSGICLECGRKHRKENKAKLYKCYRKRYLKNRLAYLMFTQLLTLYKNSEGIKTVYTEKQKENARLRAALYRKRNKELVRKRMQKWFKENPEQRLSHNRNYVKRQKEKDIKAWRERCNFTQDKRRYGIYVETIKILRELKRELKGENNEKNTK